ncbi:hypothetical protein [Actinomadura logoneensis]|uniref:hypothetical protein n=1 Tax=Actinomadura logoneensis TaxID=2293572 RepID=UPI0011C17175|nr:hypothetical protein [Actinomadura logoneensis]
MTRARWTRPEPAAELPARRTSPTPLSAHTRQLPAQTGTPLARWSCLELAAELAARRVTDTVSASTVRRWLCQDALKRWQHQT